MKLTIFTFSNLDIPDGSTIRILGYSSFLKDNQIEADFYNAYNIPKMLKKKINFIKFKMPPLLVKLIEYYCLSPKLLFFLKYLVNMYPLIKKIEKINNPIIFHQQFYLGLYLTLIKKKICIYDIHGIRYYQKDILKRISLRSKIRFYKYLIIEQNFFKYGKFFNVTSKEMKNFLIKSYKKNPNNVFIAMDGLLASYREEIDENLKKQIKVNLNLDKEKKIIFFAGTFKIIGGVLDLVKAFIMIYKKYPNIRLVLIGIGDEEGKIKELIKNGNYEKIIFLLGKVEYKYLSTYQDIADIIICPDRDNYYNMLSVPAIKVFDSLVSGKPSIFPDFNINNEFYENFNGIELFEPGNINDLADKILGFLKSYEKYSKEAISNKEKIKQYTYQNLTKDYIQRLKNRFKSTSFF